ncbi:MAG: aldehyde dehydrogenase family protein [Phycisphaeraceae bacterium]|nr:aldehyde dehydrogenase family protein [Phycisphaeraceae bacterium]
MSTPLHIPILRLGTTYRSVNVRQIKDLSTGETVAEMSVGNAGLLKRDTYKFADAQAALQAIPCEDLIAMSAKAGELFMNATLPLGDTMQTPGDYVQQLSRTSGLPHTLVRANMAKVHEALTHLDDIVRGLTRGISPEVLDRGFGEVNGTAVSFYPTTQALGMVMPSNSPGVNALWLPSIAFKTPVILKPGSDEPWTPWRVVQAMIAAGIPEEAFGFYPTDHEGSAAVMDVCDRSIIFGGEATMKRYGGDERVEVHGPGWSKVMIGEDCIDDYEKYIDIIVQSIAANSGRSCINASTIIVPKHSKAIAQAIAEKLAAITPLPNDDPNAKLSALANPKVAEWADSQITNGLQASGAVDLTEAARGGTPRLSTFEGRTYVLPTLVHCDSWDHPLCNSEFMFPFASVVEVPQNEVLDTIGGTLVVSAITHDDAFTADLLRCRDIQRLNLGPAPTSSAQWDQPHEGNLFEFLYQRRAIHMAGATSGDGR